MRTLRLNFFALAFAASLPLFAVAVAHADQPSAPTSVWDYHHAVNPATNVQTSGPYDQEDLYRNSEGFPLPGDAQIR